MFGSHTDDIVRTRESQHLHPIKTQTRLADSASGRGSSQGSNIQSMFPDEPLYQLYTKHCGDDSDGYEETGFIVSRPSAMQPKTQDHRTLWCEVPQVLESAIVDQLTIT